MNPAKSVIIYLARSSAEDVLDLCRSLALLRQNFLNRFPYPVVVFVEPSFKQAWKQDVLKKSKVECHFETIEFRVPHFLNPHTIPKHVLQPKFNIGYRHMCRFFSGMVYLEPVLKDYDWYWRLDTDSFLLGPVDYDVFKFMEENRYVYGYNLVSKDSPVVSAGLWELTRRYMEDRNITPTFVYDFIKDGVWDLSYYYTNFEISAFQFWRSEQYRDYFDYVDRSGGIFKYRWGDTLIHTLAVAMFLEKSRTHCFDDIHYQHQGFLNEPKQAQNKLHKMWRKLQEICS